MEKRNPSTQHLGELKQREAVEIEFQRYFENCRKRVDLFSKEEFSLDGTWRSRLPGLHWDLSIAAINVLFAVPSIFLRRGITFFERNGYAALAKNLSRIPMGIRTRYQLQVEAKIWKQLFLFHDLPANRLERERAIDSILQNEFSCDFKELHLGKVLAPIIENELEEFFSKRAYVADLITAAITWLSAWLLFKDSSLGIWQLGRRIANKYARKQATSHFFLGEKIGQTYYHFAVVKTTKTEIFWSCALLLLSLSAIAVVASMLSEPLQSLAGIQKRQLGQLLDNLEDKVLLAILKQGHPGG